MPTREKTQLLSAAQTGRTIERQAHELLKKQANPMGSR